MEWLGIAGIAILLAYYALAAAWLARRRHVPEPPKPEAHLSPAEIRFLHKGSFDGRTLLVAILDLVARGALSLKQRPNDTSYLERSLETVHDEDLPADASLVRTALFRTGNTMVDLTDAREDALPNSANALRDWLERRYVTTVGLSRRGWTWLLAAGGAIAAATAIAITAGPGDYSIGKAIALVCFYIFGLVSVVSSITFLQLFRRAIFTMKLVIIFTLIPALPILVVLVAGSLIDFYESYGIVGIAPFVLPLLGTGLLFRIGRPRFDIPAAAIPQIDEWYRRVAAGPAPRVDSTGDGSDAIDPVAIVAVAFDAGDAAFGRLGAVFDDVTIPSDRISLFGARRGRAGDLGYTGYAATR